MWERLKSLVTGAGDALGIEVPELPTDLSAVTETVSQALGGSGVADALSGVVEAVPGADAAAVGDVVAGVSESVSGAGESVGAAVTDGITAVTDSVAEVPGLAGVADVVGQGWGSRDRRRVVVPRCARRPGDGVVARGQQAGVGFPVGPPAGGCVAVTRRGGVSHRCTRVDGAAGPP